MTTLHPIVASLIAVNAVIKTLNDLEGWLNGLALLGPVEVSYLLTQYVEAKASIVLSQRELASTEVEDLRVLIEEVSGLPQWEPKKVPSYWALLRQYDEATTPVVVKPFMGIPPMKGFRYYS